MCLSPKEEIIVRSNKGIERLPIKVAADLYKEKEFDVNGWAEVKKETDLEVLSFNPKTWKSEWVNVERFFKKEVFKKIEVLLEDGKKAVFSEKHPCCVYTKDGLVMKWAKDLKKDDYVFSAKNLSNNLPRNYQRFENLVLNEKLAALLGYFIADGNYLFENRKGFKNFGKPKGIQFTFKTGDYVNIREIKKIILELFGYQAKEKQDPRYNTFYLYFYNVEIARKLYDFGFKKYGRLPQVIFNSPVSVIKSFLTYYFKGDGYAKRGEIHINDLDLSRDLVWLYNFIGSPTTYRLRKQSQVINLQQSKKEFKVYGAWLNNPILAERAPAFLAQGSLVPSFSSDRMIGFATLTKYQAHTTESLKAEESDFYLTRVREVKRTTLNKKEDFFDIELAKNHLFVHSLGVVSFNCCRLRLSNKELLKKGGGLFGANPQTGSVGVVTINMPRIGYLS
ncbi:hypothetical protein FJ208_01015, partial [Candidatus Gribaldobacteria bacterium]|nr:hypothetical protein [Candidatus Gribaldobacteria bacterium]